MDLNIEFLVKTGGGGGGVLKNIPTACILTGALANFSVNMCTFTPTMYMYMFMYMYVHCMCLILIIIQKIFMCKHVPTCICKC